MKYLLALVIALGINFSIAQAAECAKSFEKEVLITKMAEFLYAQNLKVWSVTEMGHQASLDYDKKFVLFWNATHDPASATKLSPDVDTILVFNDGKNVRVIYIQDGCGVTYTDMTTIEFVKILEMDDGA